MTEGTVGDRIRVTQGWRRELVGQELAELIAGRRALSVGPDGRLLVTER